MGRVGGLAVALGIGVATGGLGPTADDLTREVLAQVAGEPLELVPEALAAI